MVPSAALRRLRTHRLLRLLALPARHEARQGGFYHPFITSYEPGEDWVYNNETQQFYEGPQLAPPTSHPADQPVPGPAGAVPEDWQQHLN